MNILTYFSRTHEKRNADNEDIAVALPAIETILSGQNFLIGFYTRHE